MARNTSALFKAIGNPIPKSALKAAQAPTQSKEYYVPPSREGKYHISTWVPREMKTSLRSIQVKDPDRDFQDLFIEALNDLFAKYNVPVVGEPQEQQRPAPVKRRLSSKTLG